MKRLLVILLCACSLDAAPRWLTSPAMRRVLTAGACAASFADAYSTRRALSAGAYERNPLVASQGRMIGLKVGVCAATVALGELAPRQSGMVTALAGAQLGVFSWATAHNVRVAESLR